MRILLAVLFCLLCSACTRVAFDQPIGAPVSETDLSFFIGDWRGSKNVTTHVAMDKTPGFLIATWEEDGKARSARFKVGSLKNDVSIIWVEDVELKAYIPLRIAGAEDGLALLYADDDAVKRLVEEGKLAGKYDSGSKTWRIAAGDWEDLLVGKDLWQLNQCMPFVKIPGPPAPEKESAAPPESAKP